MQLGPDLRRASKPLKSYSALLFEEEKVANASLSKAKRTGKRGLHMRCLGSSSAEAWRS